MASTLRNQDCTKPSVEIPDTADTADLSRAVTDQVTRGGAWIAVGSGALARPVATTLAAGGHVVSWRTMSKDGHVVKGTFAFRVGTAK